MPSSAWEPPRPRWAARPRERHRPVRRRSRRRSRLYPPRRRLHLAKIYRANGDATIARHLLKEIDDVLSHRPDLGAVDEVDEFRQILTSSAPAGSAGGAPLSPAELRLLPYLQTHLTIREIGERLFISRNTANSEIRSIYRKLGVFSRSDAVRQAMAVGLLG